MVNNHGDRKSPRPGVVPFTNGLFMAYKWWLLTTVGEIHSSQDQHNRTYIIYVILCSSKSTIAKTHSTWNNGGWQMDSNWLWSFDHLIFWGGPFPHIVGGSCLHQGCGHVEVKHGDNFNCCAKKTLAFAWVVSLRLGGGNLRENGKLGVLMGFVLLKIYIYTSNGSLAARNSFSKNCRAFLMV